MKHIILIMIFLLSPLCQADLLDQLTLEQTLQARLQNTFKMYDDSAKIVVRLQFDSFQGILPGTNSADGQKISPEKIELNDISKVFVDVYSSLDAMPEAAQSGASDSSASQRPACTPLSPATVISDTV